MALIRRWRDYRTAAGGTPIRDFLMTLSDIELADVVAGMREVAAEGLRAARHVRGDLHEVRVHSVTRDFRILFATEGRRNQVLLSLSAFTKTTAKTPIREIELAQKRLTDWRERGSARKG